MLDEAATLTAINAALTAGGHEATAALKPQAPPIVAADLEPVRARVEGILATPLAVEFEEYRHTFGRADIAPLLILTEQPGRPEKIAVSLDSAGLRQLSLGIAGDLNQSVRDAQFKWRDGAPRDVVSSRDGREVQLAATDAALAEAILGATGEATPAVAVTKPRFASSDKAKMGPFTRLGYGRTEYNGADANRSHNVELATERLDGIMVPPGEVFSFNREVGPQTAANGYKEGFGIVLAGPGQLRTVSTVGGGICQVSTTLFHGVFRAGLPIEERNWHLYWVNYAASSTGMQGLDATVYDDSGVDFQFRNTTGGWLAIEAVAGGGSARVAIYGKDPGWRVEIDEPRIYNQRPADSTPVYEKTYDLPPGEQRQTDSARAGFDADIRIRVYDRDGALIRDKTFTSSYQSTRVVIKVGVPRGTPLD